MGVMIIIIIIVKKNLLGCVHCSLSLVDEFDKSFLPT